MFLVLGNKDVFLLSSLGSLGIKSLSELIALQILAAVFSGMSASVFLFLDLPLRGDLGVIVTTIFRMTST